MAKYSIFYAVKEFSDFLGLCLVKRNLVKLVNEFNHNDKKKLSNKKENYTYISAEKDCTDASYLK